jgi:hypothetical protein
MPQHSPPPRNNTFTYYGHGGDTYGFMSDSGYFPSFSGSLSVIVNQDADFTFPDYSITCNVVAEIIMYKEIHNMDPYRCLLPHDEMYTCQTMYHKKTCVPGYSRPGSGQTLHECQSSCQ